MIFLSKNELLYKKQYDFRTNHSTYMAVFDFINDASKAIDDGMNTVGIFMDLSKAFDTIDHNILLAKNTIMVLEVCLKTGSKII